MFYGVGVGDFNTLGTSDSAELKPECPLLGPIVDIRRCG
jgi:hypothetical protein